MTAPAADPVTTPGEGTAGMTAESAAVLVDKLRRIPDTARRFVETAESARLKYRLRPGLLQLLTESGLPARRLAGGMRYDRHDLMNCSVHLDAGAVARAARRFWPAALRRGDTVGSARYELQYQTQCPAPNHGPVCDYVMVTPGGRVIERTVPAGNSDPLLRVVAAANSVWPAMPAAAKAALDEAEGLEFMMLPDAIRHSVRFARDSGLGDCMGVTRLLVTAARERGLTVRPSFGLIVAPPFAVEHYWAEILVDEVWVPVDPVLIRAMIGWGVLQRPDWHPYRSIGAILGRVADDGVVLTAHEGRAVPWTIPSRLLPSPAGTHPSGGPGLTASPS